MCDSNKQICRLCLEITSYRESEPIEEMNKDMLEALLINIDFDIGDYTVACSRCLERLRDCFNFKSHCDNTFMNVDMKVDIKKEAFESELMSYESVCQGKSGACQWCLSLVKIEAFSCTTDWGDGFVFKDVVRRCFPKLDSNAVHEGLICKPCLSNMKKYYEFMKNCEEVEQRIKRFCQMTGHVTIGKVNLAEMLNFKDYDMLGGPVIIKNECPESADENVTTKNEEVSSIKCEEIHIKDELDNELKISDHKDYDTSRNNDFSKPERKVRKTVSTGKNYFCFKCPYSSERKDLIIKHLRTHSHNEVHECFICSFIAYTKFSLKAHMKCHRGATKVYGCPECPFETNHKSSYRRHILKHKDESEVEMQKCPLCPYRSKYKGGVVAHLKVHHDVNNGNMYKCKECSYSTKYKVSLVYHQMGHMNPEEIPKHKCETCEFESKYKYSLVQHLKMHKDPEMVNKFKCEKCPYRGKRLRDIKHHMMVHSDMRPFSCDQCTYSSKCKRRLVLHKRVHQKNGEMYKCELCNYQAINNVTLKVHKAKSHMDTSVPIMKCAHCRYETTVKSCLSKHMRRWHSSADRTRMGLGEFVERACAT